MWLFIAIFNFSHRQGRSQAFQISYITLGVKITIMLFTGTAYQSGFFLEYLLGTVTHWRTVAFINAVFPVVTAIYFSQVSASQ
jgi:hypothetical protein